MGRASVVAGLFALIAFAAAQGASSPPYALVDLPQGTAVARPAEPVAPDDVLAAERHNPFLEQEFPFDTGPLTPRQAGGLRESPPAGSACPVICPPGARDEALGSEFGAAAEACGQDRNGGCNSNLPFDLPEIACGDVVCGTVQAVGGLRDTDWYQFTITSQQIVTLSLRSEVFCDLLLLSDANPGDFVFDCSSRFILRGARDFFCSPDGAVIRHVLQPGTYVAFVGAFQFDGIPCGGLAGNSYILRISCEAPCELTCPPDAVSELETCGAGTNNGCATATNQFFEPISCGETKCGTLFAQNGTRDSDWYRFYLNEPRDISATLQAELPTSFVIFQEAPDCGASLLEFARGVADDCVMTTIGPVTLQPGSYLLVLTPSNTFDGFSCLTGVNDYVLSVDGLCPQMSPDHVFVDDDWSTLPDATPVFFPGNADRHYIGYDAFATIQAGINAVSGSIVDVAAGSYNENLYLDKHVLLRGVGNGTNPANATIVTSAGADMPVLAIDGDAASGISEVDRTIIQQIRFTGATGNGDAGSGIRVTSGTLTRFLTFDRVAAAGNAGNGIGFDGAGDVNDIVVVNAALDGNAGTGLRLASSLGTFDGLSISGTTISNNGVNGVSTGPSGSAGVTNITLSGCTLSANGDALSSAGAGSGDLSFFQFNGNATISNTTITGSGANVGIQFRGDDAILPAGTINLQNVQITGSYQHPNTFVGSGLMFANYASLSNVLISNVTVDITRVQPTKPAVNVYLDATGPISLGTLTLGGQVDADILNLTPSAADATVVNFSNAASNYEIEDRVLHAIDDSQAGLVTWIPNNVYVTPNSVGLLGFADIQRGIDAVASGGIVNVQLGSYPGGLSVSKALTIRGDRGDVNKAGPGPNAPTIDGANAPGSGIELLASGVTIEGLRIQGFAGLAADGEGCGVLATVGRSNITIRDCLLTGNNWADIRAWTNGATRHANWTIALNEIEKGAWAADTNMYALELYNLRDSLVSDNLIRGGYSGILLAAEASSAPVTTERVTLQNNLIREAVGDSGNVGIFSRFAGATMRDITLTGNRILDAIDVGNGRYGVRSFALDGGVFGGTLLANFNWIAGNGIGLQNDTAILWDAENNWWGSADGPEDALGTTEVTLADCGNVANANMLNLDPPGMLGDAVSANVDYCPWLGAVARMVIEIPQTCITSQRYIARVMMKDLLSPATGFQALIEYDDAQLTFRPDLSHYTPSPFSLHVVPLGLAETAPGELDLDGSASFSDTGSDEDGMLVELVFDVAPAAVFVGPAVTFRPAMPFDSQFSYLGETLPTELIVDERCSVDFNNDGQVGLSDLGVLLGCWQMPCGDLDCDGTTGLPDLGVLLGAWGPDPCQ